MTVKIYDTIEQQSPEWRKIRVGKPTCSRFADMMAEGKGLTRQKYLRQLAGEFISGRPMETYQNGHMLRGIAHEPALRSEYEFLTGNKVRQVGFITNGRAGASPDGLIGDDGAVECKSALPDILIDIMLRDNFPAEHRAQCQGTLFVSERKWIDLVIGCEGMPLYIRKAFRDETYISEIDREVDRFNRDLAAMVAKIKARR